MESRYQPLYELGRGANGVVEAVYDTETDTTVARKTMLLRSPRSAVELKREFRALASTNHDNLVRLFELEAREQDVSFTMELVDGVDIVSYARTHPDQIRGLLAQAVAGCHTMHARGWLHRDIKPSNILVARGRVVILDFGLIGVLGMPTTGTFYGTPLYACPEQFSGEEVDERSDIFSLGVIAFEMLFGTLPDWQRRWRMPAPPDDAAADPDLIALVMSMLRMERAARPSGREVLARLLGDVTGAPESTTFVGREVEFGRALAPTVVESPFRLVVIEGESGIGKSRFLAELLARHVARGGLAFRAECRLWEKVAYRAIDPIVDELGTRLEAARMREVLTALERTALSEAFATLDLGEIDATASPAIRREAVASGLGKLLTAAGGTARLAVAIDDFQWADPDSVALLRDVVRAGALRDLDLILVSRSDDCRVLNELLETVHADERILLGPLSLEESAELIRSNESTASIDIAAMHAMSGGSPFYLSEAIRHLSDNPEQLRAGNMPDIPQRKMDLLAPAARRLVEWVCVSDAPVGTELAVALLGGDRTAYYELLSLQKDRWLRSVATRDGVEYEAYHSKLRDHVLERLGDTKPPLHDRFAAVLEHLYPNRFESLTFHLHEAGRDADAAGYAMKSGVEAQRRLAFTSARSFLEKAMAWGKFESEQASELALRHAQVLYNLGDCAKAAQAAEAAPAGSYLSSNDRAVFVADSWFSAGYLDSGLRALETVMGERALVDAGRRMLMLKVAALLLRLRWTALREPRPSPTAVRWRAEMYRSLGKISMMSSKFGIVFQLQGLIEWLELGDERNAASGLAFLANVYAHAGIFPGFRTACMERARAIGTRLHDAYVLGTCDVWDCNTALINEDWKRAAELSERAVDTMEGQHFGMAWECVTARNFLLMSLEKLGEIDRMLALARQFIEVAEVRNDSYSRTVFLLLELYWSIATRTGAQTRERVAALRALWGSGMFTVQHFYMLRLEVYSHLMEDDVDEAWELLEQSWPLVKGSDALDLPTSTLDAHLLRAVAALHMLRKHGAGRGLDRIVRRQIRALRSTPLREARGYADLVQAMLAKFESDEDAAAASTHRAEVCFGDLGAGIGGRYAAALKRALNIGAAPGQPACDPEDRYLSARWLDTMLPIRRAF